MTTNQLLNISYVLGIVFLFTLKNLFILNYFWLSWVFIAVCGLSLFVVSGGYSLVGDAWASHRRAWALGARRLSSCPHGLSCSVACWILPVQGSNQCPLHCKVNFQPLGHQGSHGYSINCFIIKFIDLILMTTL